jgi:hypothetical protein
MLHTGLIVAAVALLLVLLPGILLAVVGGMAHVASIAPHTFSMVLLSATLLGSLAHLTRGYPLALAMACGLLLVGQLGIEFLRDYRGL